MFKMFDYICNNEQCSLDLQPVELLVSEEFQDDQLCEKCAGKLRRIMSATKGYVKGSDTPVRQ